MAIFLKLTGIAGGTQGSEPQEVEMELLDWAWGISNTVDLRNPGKDSGQSEVQDIQITKLFDFASPVLIQLCAASQRVAQGTITCLREIEQGQFPYMVITADRVAISQYSLSATDAENQQESFALHFAEVRAQFNSQGPDGGIESTTEMHWVAPVAAAS